MYFRRGKLKKYIMGLFDKIRNEFVDILEFIDKSSNTIVYRFERYQNEIKNGAQLIVRECQQPDTSPR